MKIHLKRTLVNEVIILVCGFLCYFLVISLYVQSISDFMNRIGVQAIPLALLARSIFFGIFSLVYAGVSTRFRQQRIFAFLLLIFALFFAVLPHLQNEPFFLTVYFYFITSFFFIFLDSGLMLFASNFVNPIRAKYFLPLLSGFTSLGLIVGSYFSADFNALNRDAGFGYIPACILVFVATLVSALSQTKVHQELATQPLSTAQALAPHQPVQKSKKNSIRKEIGRSIEYVMKTPLFRSLALATVLFVCMQFFIEFKQNTVLTRNVLPEDINFVLGKIFFAENILRLALSVFFMKKILFRFGVINTMLIFAIGVLLAIASAFVLQWDVTGMVLVYLTFIVLFFVCYQIAASQTISLLPENLVQGVSFVFNQFGVAVASIIASCFLLLYSYNLELEPFVNTFFITAFALFGAYILLTLKKSYQAKIQENIFSQNPFLQHKAIDLLAEKAQKNKGESFLRLLLQKPDLSPELQQNAIYSLSLIGNPESIADLVVCLEAPHEKIQFSALQALHHMLRHHNVLRKYPFTKHQLLDAFKKIFISNVPYYIKQEIMHILRFFEIDDIVGFLESNLRNEDKHIVRYTMETLASFHDRSIIRYLRPFLMNEDPYLRSSAIVGLWSFPDLRSSLLEQIGNILRYKNEQEEECAVFLIDHLNLYWEKRILTKILEEDGDHRNALYALITLIKLGQNEYIERLVQKMIELERKGEKEKLELLLSKYRGLSLKTKKNILGRINSMSLDTIRIFSRSFSTSRYIFNRELEVLNVD